MPTFIPKSDKELNDERLLPEGEYDFEVVKAENKISKPKNGEREGSPMIKLDIRLYLDDGAMRMVSDFLVFKESSMFKISQFSKCVGLYELYKAGKIDAEDCVGRGGKLKLKIDPEGEFPSKNSVKSYVVPKKKESVSDFADAEARRLDLANGDAGDADLIL